jgi:hypothetical protein
MERLEAEVGARRFRQRELPPTPTSDLEEEIDTPSAAAAIGDVEAIATLMVASLSVEGTPAVRTLSNTDADALPVVRDEVASALVA